MAQPAPSRSPLPFVLIALLVLAVGGVALMVWLLQSNGPAAAQPAGAHVSQPGGTGADTGHGPERDAVPRDPGAGVGNRNRPPRNADNLPAANDPAPPPPPAVPAGPTIVVQGVVLDSAGAPVAAARIEPLVDDWSGVWECAEQQARTDADGRFTLRLTGVAGAGAAHDLPPPDGLWMDVSPPDREKGGLSGASVLVPGNELANPQTIRLVRYGKLRLRVVWPPGMATSEDDDGTYDEASIVIMPDPANGIGDGDYDSGAQEELQPPDATLEVGRLMWGRHFVTLQHPHLQTLVASVQVGPTADAEYVLRPQTGATVRVRVLAASGKPMDMAVASLEPAIGDSRANGGRDDLDDGHGEFTDRNGEAVFTGVTPGRYRAAAKPGSGFIVGDAGWSVEAYVDVPDAGEILVELAHPHTTMPDFRVLGPDGNPIASGYLSLASFRHGAARHYQVFIADGRVHESEKGGLPAGTYAITMDCRGLDDDGPGLFLPRPVAITVPVDGPVTIQLEAARVVRGRIGWADGTPLETDFEFGPFVNPWTPAAEPVHGFPGGGFELQRGATAESDEAGVFEATIRWPGPIGVQVEHWLEDENGNEFDFEQRLLIDESAGAIDVTLGGRTEVVAQLQEAVGEIRLTLRERHDGGPPVLFRVTASCADEAVRIPRLIPGRYDLVLDDLPAGTIDVREPATSVALRRPPEPGLPGAIAIYGRVEASNAGGNEAPMRPTVMVRQPGTWTEVRTLPDGTFLLEDVEWHPDMVLVAFNADGRAIEPVWPVPRPRGERVHMVCGGAHVVGGVRVLDLDPAGPGAWAGLQRLDVITHYAGNAIGNLQGYLEARERHAADGHMVDLWVRRRGEDITRTIAPGSLAARIR